ncbi:hypothetical protein L1987_25438 [Smallanthus sonchifolius]|uniref:Uncharacterized protein n=1 Tax=Smallanthus sonchifolius TaxID=185202 RepID=A0ACB9INS8_9ASTR|nr:hypothetical protein L1987_25438 [Smallanthus sonchifolius]
MHTMCLIWVVNEIHSSTRRKNQEWQDNLLYIAQQQGRTKNGKLKLSRCFLLCMKDDSMEGIYDTLKECALISKSTGGIGVYQELKICRRNMIRGIREVYGDRLLLMVLKDFMQQGYKRCIGGVSKRFFGAFGLVLYPLSNYFHLDALADKLLAFCDRGFLDCLRL